MIPGVEHLCAELKCRSLVHGKGLLNSDIIIVDARAIEDRRPAIPEVPHSGDRKAGGIKPEKTVAADVIGEPVAASVAGTIREGIDEGRSGSALSSSMAGRWRKR